MVKSACGIEAAYMCFNGTGIWGGETIMAEKAAILNLIESKNFRMHPLLKSHILFYSNGLAKYQACRGE